ncbi:MAG: BamA/TamA family outer membrane protein [Firmicutes bacterium]|nr:BamA/TamA family outer membrane protein [Bacillota bacterium]
MSITAVTKGRPLVAVLITVLISVLISPAAFAGDSINPPVRKIEIAGNEKVATDEILQAITNTKLGMPVDEDLVKKDLQAIADLGYFSDVRANFRQYQDGVKIIFEVVENPVVKGIEIKGNSALPADKLRELIPVKDGEILNVNTLNKGLQSMLEDAFKEYGIPARITDVQVKNSGIIEVQLAETRVNQIIIEGNEKTRDYVIRREIRLKPGDVLNMVELHKDLRNVLNLGFFDDVSREFRETSDPDVVDLVIKVKERRTGTASLGAAISSTDGLLGYIEVAEDNLFGKGQRANIKLEFGKDKTLYRLGFFEPYINEKTSGGFNIYNERSTEYDAENRSFVKSESGLDATLGRELGEDLKGYLKLRVYDTAEDYPETERIDEQGKTRSLTFSVIKDTRDFFLRPSKGSRQELSVEVAPSWLGSEYQFNRYIADYSKYFTVNSKGHVLALHGRVGHIQPTGGEGISDTELFRVGGPDTVRGYEYSEAFTGQSILVLNAEYRFKIADKLDGVIFYDTGNAWKADEKISLSDLHTGIGVGVRIDTPVGIMRIDYGVGEGSGKTYFSLGQTF